MNTSQNNSDDSVVKPTIIDLDADQVIDQDAPAAPVAPAKRRRSGLLLPGLALVTGLVGGSWLYRDVLHSYLPSDQITALTTRLDVVEQGNAKIAVQLENIERLSSQLKTDVDAIEDATTATQGEAKTLADGLGKTQSTIAALQTQVDEARASLTKLANRPATSTGTGPTVLNADITTRLTAIEKDIAALKASGGDTTQDSAALAQALSDLKAKVDNGLGFVAEHDRIARMVPAASGLDVLKAHASAGLPAAIGLAQELAAISAALPAPQPTVTPQTDKSWWDTITDSVSDLIIIRDANTQDWRVVTDKSRAFAESGDLPQAIAALDEAEGAKPVALQSWRDRAQARLDLEAAVASVADAVTRTLAAGQ